MKPVDRIQKEKRTHALIEVVALAPKAIERAHSLSSSDSDNRRQTASSAVSRTAGSSLVMMRINSEGMWMTDE